MNIFDAVQKNNLKAVEQLIREGVDINELGLAVRQKTPLHCVRDNAVAKVLIAAGADVNARDLDGNTPLHCTGNFEVIKTLIAAGADTNAKNESGWTPLQHFVFYDDVERFQALIAAGADVNARDKDGMTPLIYAQSMKTFDALIEAGADVNALDNDGNTPLHWAGNLERIQALIKAGADPSTLNNKGQWPEDRAEGEAQSILRETRIAQEKKQLEQDNPQNLPDRPTPRISRGECGQLI